MRVLLVNDWTTAEGGVENYVVRLHDGLCALGDDVRILASRAGEAGLRAHHLVPGSRSPLVQAFAQVADPRVAIAARRVVRSFRPDAVHVSMFELLLSPAVFLAFRGTRTVVNVGWYKPVCPTGHKLLPDGRRCGHVMGAPCRAERCLGAVRYSRERARYAALRSALAAADEIVVPSDWMRAELERVGLRSTVVGRSVALPPSSYRRRRTARPLIAYLGRLSPEKGVSDLLRAVGRLERKGVGLGLEIAGDGPSARSLRSEAAALGLSDVAFVGHVPHEAIDDLFGRAWALVLPTRWAEPFGNVVVEALVRGVPVIATDGGGPAELVRPGRSGTLVPSADVEALASAIEELVTGRAFPSGTIDEELRAEIAGRHEASEHARLVRSILAGAAAV